MTFAEDNLWRTFTRSEKFREFVGADTEEDAGKKVYIDDIENPQDGQLYAEDELYAIRPYALIMTGDDGYTLEWAGTASYLGGGQMQVLLEANRYAQGGERRDRYLIRHFKNHVAAIVHDIANNASEVPGSLWRPTIAVGPVQTAKEERSSIAGYFFQCVLSFMWGTQAGGGAGEAGGGEGVGE